MITISRIDDAPDYIPALRDGTIHVVGFAETGLSFFRSYLEFAFGYSLRKAVELCNKINEADETGTIFPLGNLTGLPVRFFRQPIYDQDRKDLRRCIRDAFVANRDYCKSEEIVFHFGCGVLNQDLLDEEITKHANSLSDDPVLRRVTLVFDEI